MRSISKPEKKRRLRNAKIRKANLSHTGRAQRQRSSLTVILYEIWERGRSGFSPVF